MEKDPYNPGVVGILEKWEMCEWNSKWAELVIDGEEYSMKYGNLTHLVYTLPDMVWPVGKRATYFDLIVKEYPGWPVGYKVKHIHGEIVALWVPTKGVWLRAKQR